MEILVLALAILILAPPLTDAPDWARDVRPILAKNCLNCHGADPETREAGLRLDDRATILEHGILDLDDVDASILLERLTAPAADRMPPAEEGPGLSPDEIEILRAWVEAGAPVDVHWAFESPHQHMPPMLDALDSWTKQPLDGFVASRLEQEELEPSPKAHPLTLLRRASLDLTGLPPEPEQIERYLAEDPSTRYESAIDRLLTSPHYGEHWAARWLDLARYADTQGYEQDRGRTIWPWRDWVVDAYNEDMAFDEFTVRQIAGDLLVGSSDRDVLATAFHRNTMTNSEGGTNDEEFRVAAIIDRVNTTYQTWMGLTMSCAQCHAHKYDPFSQEEYYGSFALLNQTADADRVDDAPNIEFQTDQQRERARDLAEELRTLAEKLLEDAPAGQPLPSRSWIDDGLPPGATPQGEDAPAGWPWRSELGTPDAKPFSGWRASESTAAANAFAQHYFDNSAEPLLARAGEKLVAHVLIDPERPPDMIMVQVHSPDGAWEHRAYWGANHGSWGVNETPARLPMGELPETGDWVRLEVELARIGIAEGTAIDGIALSQHGGPDGGHLWWDAIGFETNTIHEHPWQETRSAWEANLLTVDGRSLDPDAAEALRTDVSTRTAEDDRLLEVTWRAATGRLGASAIRYEEARSRLDAARMQRVSTPVMQALPEDARRTTHLLRRGAWNDPLDEVLPGIPGVLLTSGIRNPSDRLTFANWIASRENPLTARVQVNRIWEALFGRGIVLTSEDFGTQGDLPANQELLDHLANRFVELGWSQKAFLKEVLTSATYQQASAVSSELLERDPDNVLLARGPRFRLDAETIRDQALAIGGLLDERLGGPPVFPAQPEGTWQVVYNGSAWNESPPGDRHRRGLYTYWRRTAPYPSMTTFDAPSREVCVSRRIRTNTPLQALVVLNDPVYLEAAAGLASRMLEPGADEATDDHARIARGFIRSTGRTASDVELATLTELLEQARLRFAEAPGDAATFIESCRASTQEDPVEFAAWIVLGNVLLNLDEVLVKS